MSKKSKRANRGRKAPGASPKSQGGGKQETFKNIALRYVSNGLRVVPMHTIKDGHCSCYKGANCDRPGKHPCTPNGVKDARNNRKAVRKWWADYPKANLGIATGKKSKVVVLDIDPRNDGIETLKKLEVELGALPETVTSKTGGGGQHLVFKYPQVRIVSDSAGKRLGPGVDVLSNGKIMVAPPSRHKSGDRYQWMKGKSFEDLKPAHLPDKWLDKLTDDPAVAEPTKVTTDTITEGARNTTLTSLAGTMQRAGASADTISAALVAENKAKCSPPLDDAEVEKIVKSVSQYSVPPGGDRADDAEKLVTMVLSQHFAGGKHLRFGADTRFWLYSGKVWERAADNWIDGRILESIKGSSLRTSQQTASLMKQVRSLMAAQLAVNGDPFGFLADPPHVINCANGEVWIADDGTADLRPHDPESYLRHLLDVSYDAKAKCKEYDKAVLEIFSKANKPKVLRRHWNELVGYVIQPKRNIPLIAILLGAGDNGKTVLTRTIVKLIGPAQVQAQRVEELDSNRFAMGGLLGKLLCVPKIRFCNIGGEARRERAVK